MEDSSQTYQRQKTGKFYGTLQEQFSSSEREKLVQSVDEQLPDGATQGLQEKHTGKGKGRESKYSTINKIGGGLQTKEEKNHGYVYRVSTEKKLRMQLKQDP